MIANHDRSGWMGASDTSKIMGNWNTKTFNKWWLEKLGLHKNTFTSTAMKTGSALEHRILDALGVRKRDRQIKVRRYRLRVNLDGEDSIIHEVKTYSADKFKIPKAYKQQAQVEMFVTGKPLTIDAYRLEPDDYINWFRPIDKDRLSTHPLEYDRDWINNEYLPRLKYLAECLKRKRWPDAGFNKRSPKQI